MKVIKMIEVPAEQSNHPIFVGGQVTTQPLVADDMGANFNISIVNFSPGARNKFHSHSSDQVLLVTAGSGIVATDCDETSVNVGDMIHIPAGEKHWHGATKESAFSHISITQLGSTGRQLE